MNLTQLEMVETELKCTRYSQNKVLKLTGLKRQSCGHQERLKRSWDGKDMAKTRFRGFSAKKLVFRCLSAKNQGLEHYYAYKHRGLYAKSDKKGL
jgi:hypothetical protein